MKYFYALLFIAASVMAHAQWAEIRSVDAWVEINPSTPPENPSLTLRWMNQSYYTGCQVQRRTYLNTGSWGNVLGTIPAGDSSWTDNNVEKGRSYEYRIMCSTNRTDPNTNNTTNITSVSYLLAGIETGLTHRRGNLGLVIDSTISGQLEAEIDQLAMDLAGDGWTVHRLYVDRDTTAAFVKSQIEDLHNRLEAGLQALYLLGHVPVPYSGNFSASTYYPPDAHVPDHNGAWAADVYYGVLNGTWTDNITNETGINREANKNRPGDGKWDQFQIPGKVSIQVGRVDLSNMPAFAKSEVELLRQYLNKSRDFRHGVTPTYELALIDDNFRSMGEGFATTAWTNFSAMFRPQNIRTSDFITTLKDSAFLMAYGCGAGSYTSCNGIGNTTAFTTGNGAAFNFLFGSYFGDWDVSNNFLRAPLASDKLGLTNAWSGRPFWHAHGMALGRNIGESCLITQNNINQDGDYLGMNFRNTVHIALMGDPTLRMHVVKPPSALQLNRLNNGSQVQISWTPSPDPEVSGYYVYRGKKADSTFNLVAAGPIINNSFVDSNPYDENSYYMVRAVKLQYSASGSYLNLSQGISGYIDQLQGNPLQTKEVKPYMIRIVPNPASGIATLYLNPHESPETVALYNMQGQLLLQQTVSEGSDRLQINLSNYPSGIYVLRSGVSSQKFIIQH